MQQKGYGGYKAGNKKWFGLRKSRLPLSFETEAKRRTVLLRLGGAYSSVSDTLVSASTASLSAASIVSSATGAVSS